MVNDGLTADWSGINGGGTPAPGLATRSTPLAGMHRDHARDAGQAVVAEGAIDVLPAEFDDRAEGVGPLEFEEKAGVFAGGVMHDMEWLLVAVATRRLRRSAVQGRGFPVASIYRMGLFNRGLRYHPPPWP
jgi:hypothetical protein